MNSQTKQRYISTSIWSDDWFDSLSEREKLVYFYLLTNDHTNPAGVYQCTLKNVRLEIGLDREEIERIMAKFSNAGKAMLKDGYMIIPRWLKHQKIAERENLYFAARAVLISLPRNIKAFILENKELFDFEEYKEFQACLEDIVEDGVITTIELSERLGLSRGRTLKLAAKIFEDKIANGKTTLWTEREAELIREYCNTREVQDKVRRRSGEGCESHAKVPCKGEGQTSKGEAKVKGDSDSDLDIYSSGPSSTERSESAESHECGQPVDNSPQKPPPNLYKLIKKKVKAVGYYIDEPVARKIDNAIPNQTWFAQSNSIVDFVAKKISDIYSKKTDVERRRLFVSALISWENIRDEYPDWLANQRDADERRRLESLVERRRDNPPKACPHCGAEMNGRICPQCEGFMWFDEEKREWEYQERHDFNLLNRKNSHGETGPPDPLKPEGGDIDF
jgi:hypothetical protein